MLPMFVLADSDIEEEELRPILLKLKRKFSKLGKLRRESPSVKLTGSVKFHSRKRKKLTDISDCYCSFCNAGRIPLVCDHENSSSSERSGEDGTKLIQLNEVAVEFENHNVVDPVSAICCTGSKKRKFDISTCVNADIEPECINCDIDNTSPVKENQKHTWCSSHGLPKENTQHLEHDGTSQTHCSGPCTISPTLSRTVIDVSRYVAMDCEFVGVGPKKLSALGRCTVLDYYGNPVIDIYARPEQVITDYRTRWSGLRKRDMISAIPFQSAQTIIKHILKDKIVVGHALFNDFKVLSIKHPKENIRDTASHKPLRSLANFCENRSVSLKNLSKALLGRVIQSGEHCSSEDSLATLDLYKLVQTEWEEKLADRRRKQKCNENYTNQKALRPDISKFEVSYLSDEFWPKDLFEKFECDASI